MSAIKNVAIIGASGNLGSVVISTLLASGEFNLTAITRPVSTATFPASVTVARVDTSSVADLTEAFKGQDAVISIAATAAAGAQDVIIDAAIAARVRRFIPSEFGINTRKDRDSKFGKLVHAKVETTDRLERLAKEHEWFSYTALSTSLFFDWVSSRLWISRVAMVWSHHTEGVYESAKGRGGSQGGMRANAGEGEEEVVRARRSGGAALAGIADNRVGAHKQRANAQAIGGNAVFLKPATKTARIVDSGNERFSPSTLSFVARAVLAVLQRPEATANRYLAVSGLDVTQNEVLAAAEEIQGVKYDVSHVTSAELDKVADEKFAKGDFSAFVDVLEVHLYGDGASHAVQGTEDNELLGLEKEDLKEVLRKILL